MSIHVFPTIPSPTAVIFSDLSLPKSLDDDFRTASLRCLASMAAAPVADDVCTPASNNAYRYTVWYHVGRRVGTHDGMRSRVYRRCEVENEEDEMTNIDAVESRINTGIQTRLCFFFCIYSLLRTGLQLSSYCRFTLLPHLARDVRDTQRGKGKK